MLAGPVEPSRPRVAFQKTADGRGTIPTFENRLDISITLYWIKNDGTERQIAVMPPGDRRPPQSWSVYPRSGCWVAKDGEKELLRVSSTTVGQYGFQVGGQLQSKNENWVPHGQPGAEEPPDPPPAATTTTTTYSAYSPKKSPTGFCGLSNQGATCYLNSLLQSLYMTPELRAALWQWEWDAARNAEKEKCIPYQLQRLFVNLYTSDDRAVSTEALTKSFGWTGSDAFAQHDVQEMFILLKEALETTFAGTPQAKLMQSLYEGKQRDGVRCKECGTLSAKPDSYNHINLTLRQFGQQESIKSVEEGLSFFFEQEPMEGENQYQCDKCGKLCDAEKGLSCMTVPYILFLTLTRFHYDWELDRRIKLDDRVTFPMTLDMAPYLCDPDEQPPPADAADAVPAPEPEAAGGGGAPVPAAEFEPAFGRDGALIKPVDKRAVEQGGDGTLPYELFAVLVHRGTAAFGHYYAYIKDFKTGQWLEFNDGTVTAASVSDVEKAFGGPAARTTTSTYTGYGAKSTQSTASAYMVMYRRKDETANMHELTQAMVPARVLEDMEKQAKEKAEKDAEAAAIKAQLALSVHYGSRVVCLNLAKTTPWGTVKAQALEQLGGLEGIGLDASSVDCWRMRTIKFLHDDCADEILDDDDSTELISVKAIKPYGPTDLLIETKKPDEEWPRHYGEFGPAGYQHHRVFKMALYSPGSSAEDSETEAGGDVLSESAAGSMSPWKTIMFGYKATLGDLREAVADAFGTQPGAKVCKLTIRNESVIELVGEDSVGISSLRHPLALTSGDRLFVAHAEDAAAISGTAFKAAAIEVGERAIVHFTNVDSDSYTHHIEGDKNTPLVELKDKISAALGVEPGSISLHDPAGRAIVHASNHARRVRVMVKTATGAGGSGSKVHKLPVYLFKGDKDDLSTLLLKEVEVDSKLSVPAFKAALRAQLVAALAEGQPADQYGPEDGSHLRVRKLDYSSAVWMDSQTVAEAMGTTLYGVQKLGVTKLSEPEVKTSKEQVVISVARWRPSTLEIDQPHRELIVKSQMECSEVRRLLLPLLSQTTSPADSAATPATPPATPAAAEDIGLLMKKYNMNSKVDIRKGAWDADRAPPREYTNYQGQKISTPPTSHIGHCTDGTLLYYRLNTEPEKQMTEDETKKWEQKVKKEATSAKRRVAEVGVKINVAAAGSKATPSVSIAPADGASQG